MELIDTHAHLNLSDYDDLDEVVLRAQEAGVTRIVVVGIDLKSSRKALELSERFSGYIFAVVGIHPHEVKHLQDRD